MRLFPRAGEEDVDIRDALAGIHIEGPYISAEDGPRGAHDLCFVRDPDIGEFREWQRTANGMIKIVTLAPERKGALEFIRYICEQGIIAAIGHTAADPLTIQQAIRARRQIFYAPRQWESCLYPSLEELSLGAVSSR